MSNYISLIAISDFLGRYEWLKKLCVQRTIGERTFGGDRWVNQDFYHSKEWKEIRRKAIIRDDGCDLGIFDRPISGRIVVHHILPVTIDTPFQEWLDLDNLICCSHNTHEAIHYGSEDLLFNCLLERSKNDQCPWK